MNSLETALTFIDCVGFCFTGFIILLISIVALVFLALYLFKSREYNSLHKRFKALNKRYSEACRDNLKKEGKINHLRLELDRLKSESTEVNEDA